MFLPSPRRRFVFIIFVGGVLEKSILFPESQTKEGGLRLLSDYFISVCIKDPDKSDPRDLLVKCFMLFCCGVIKWCFQTLKMKCTFQQGNLGLGVLLGSYFRSKNTLQHRRWPPGHRGAHSKPTWPVRMHRGALSGSPAAATRVPLHNATLQR